MPNPRFPKNIYLQGNLRLTEKRTVRQDARISGEASPGPTQRPNNSIPLLDWINEQFEQGTLIFDCNCDESKCPSPRAKNDIFLFKDNGLSYQFLDILANDVFNKYDFDSIEIIDTDGLSGDRTVEVVSSPYFPHPIIKLTKPSASEDVLNIDEPEEFTYRIIDACETSNIATVTIYPSTVNLEQIIESSYSPIDN